VVVGAGLPHYFKNCIDSVKSICSEEIFAFYNYVGDDDKRIVEGMAEETSHRGIQFFLQPNQSGPRTGSLYQCYNRALAYAAGEFRYVSFIQADMQMMWWDSKIIDACDQIRNSLPADRRNKISFYSQLPIRGKRPDYYSIWDDYSFASVPSILGMADVGIFALDNSIEHTLRFKGSEKQMAEEARIEGHIVALHPYPFLAPIPFPDTIRDKKHRPLNRGSAYFGTPILKLGDRKAPTPNFNQPSMHPLFMEDVVWPNGWECLTPYWPSDTEGTNWLRNRFSAASPLSLLFWSVQKSGRKRLFPTSRFRPGFKKVFHTFVAFFFEELKNKFKRSATLSTPSERSGRK